MVKQLLSSVYQIKQVIEGPKFVEENGKKVAFYKVRWQDTYEPAYNLPKKEIENFRAKRKRKAKILGPVAGSENGNLQNMDFAVELDCSVHVIPYKQIKAEFKDELIEFFEKKARPLEDKSNSCST